MRRIDPLGIALVAAMLLLVVIFVSKAGAANRWGAGYFPNVPLTTQDGNTVHLYDDLLKGKTVVVSLFYSECQDSCPLETARLVQVQKMLGDHVGKDVFFYSISIDPEHDTPAVLKAYAEKFHVGPGWLFLTGKKADINLVGRKLGLDADSTLNRDGHTVDLMIGNEPTGQWLRNSATDNARFLATNISTLVDGWNRHKPEVAKSYAQAQPLAVADRGQYLFATRCAPCHTIGNGVKIGPDLQGVTSVRDHTWLFRFIQKPDVMLTEKDPLATALFKQYKEIRMPNVRLGPDDTEALVKYLEGQSTKSGHVASKNVENEKNDRKGLEN
ncbi:MAG TPA: SCO family protein [Candidatus Angelobacter sp.]|jgi:protein SCO1/2